MSFLDRGFWTKVSVPRGRPFFSYFAFHSWIGVSGLRSRFREVGHFFSYFAFHSCIGVSGLRSRFREVGHLL